MRAPDTPRGPRSHADAVFITRVDEPGDGPRLAVKDVIDVAGIVPTWGSAAVAQHGVPAGRDALCVAMLRAAGCRVVGTTNLHELANGGSGINPWFGTPVNPLDPARVPGGSSSGSAVAVATDQADLALGTDTGGSTRIPAACCGVAGLKLTGGAIPLDGIMPLAPTLDAVGLLARRCTSLVGAMAMLEPSFTLPDVIGLRVGRLAVGADAVVDDAIDAALALTGWRVENVAVPSWAAAEAAGFTILLREAARIHGGLADRVGADVGTRLRAGLALRDEDLLEPHRVRGRFRAELRRLLQRFDVLALPTLPFLAPRIDALPQSFTSTTRQANLAGLPALAVPVGASPLPASLQLLAPWGREDLLLGAGIAIERTSSPPRASDRTRA